MNRRTIHRRRSGFLLLEIILAVAIFTLGVLSLGRCLTNCLVAQQIRAQEERARSALEGSMLEIQAKPGVPEDYHKEQLNGRYAGITMIERRKALDVKNENNVNLGDIHEVTLIAEWTSPDGRPMSRSLEFDLLRGRGVIIY